MIKKIKQPLILFIFLLILTPSALFSLDTYWNLGEGSFSFGLTKDTPYMGGQFELINFYLRDYKTNLGLKFSTVRAYVSSAVEFIENDDGSIETKWKGVFNANVGTGIDFFWSPLNINPVSRCGPFISLYGGVFPNPEFSVFIGVEFLWAKVMLFEDCQVPWVLDIVHVRAGFLTQNQSFCVTVGVDLVILALLFQKE